MTPFFDDSTIGKDYVMFPVYHQMELQYSIEHGSWPLFVPGFAGGRPAAALTLGQIFHPISHVASHLPGYWSGYAFDLNTLLRLLCLALTQIVLLLLLHRWGLETIVAFVVSLVTVYNLRMLDLFRFGASLESYTAHLMLAAAMVNYYSRPSKLVGPAAVIVATYLVTVSGHPQMMHYGLIASAVFGLAVPFLDAAVRGVPRAGARALVKFYLATTICLGAGILLAAAHILPQYFDFAAETTVRLGRNYRWSLFNGDSWGGELNSYFRPLKAAVTGAYGSSSLIVLTLLFPFTMLMKPRPPAVILALWGAMALVFMIAIGEATPFHRLFWEYVPLANAFRVPGRITMLQPILLFGLLSWFFRAGQPKVLFETGWVRIDWRSSLALAGLALFLVYNLWICDLVPPALPPLPDRFGDVPPWAHDLLFGLGIVTLVLAALRIAFSRFRSLLGVALALTVLVEVSTLMRYGTWIQQRLDSPTLEKMDRQKKARLAFRQRPGNKMQSDLVNRKMTQSFLESDLARFYRRFRSVADQDEAFRVMARSRRADEIVVEGRAPTADGSNETVGTVAREDRVELEHAQFNRVVFFVSNAAPGFLVYSPLDRSRWRATVDGAEHAIVMANGGEQAVYLAAGHHRVEFRFTSVAATVGMAVSLTVLLGLALYATWIGLGGRLRVFVLPAAALGPLLLGLWWSNSLYGGDHLGTRYAWSSGQLPEPTNLAYGRKAKMSSILNQFRPYNCYAGRGVDGHRMGMGFATSRKGKRPWWQVDLGRKQPLGEIVVHDGAGVRSAKHLPLSVLLSDDGRAFRRVKQVARRGKERPWRIDVSGHRGRVVRLRSSRKGSLTFNEVEIFPPRGEEPTMDKTGHGQSPPGRPR